MTTVVFDFGGVLGLPQDPDAAAEMAGLCGRPLEEFRRIYPVRRLELDRGVLSPGDYWAGLVAPGRGGLAAATVARLEQLDALSWTRVNHGMVAWAGELRAAGIRTTILSNMPFGMLAFMRASRTLSWLPLFEGALFSCEHGLVKPEPAFFRLCLERLGAAAGDCLFLDDSTVNVEAAAALGITALRHAENTATGAEVRRLTGLPVRSLVA